MGGTGVVDRFLDIFSRYIDSGFGLLGGEVAFIATTLIVIDVTLAALFWSWGEQDDIIARLVKKTLFVGIFAYIIGNWNSLARIVFESFAGLAGGARGVGEYAASSAASPLRKAGDGVRQSFREGSRDAITKTGGTITPGPNTPPSATPDSSSEQPAWAKAMKDRQTITHGATIAAHTLKSGDSHGGGASVDTSEKD